MRTLVAIPVFNEVRHVQRVVARVLHHAPHVLVIDDGSTDGTSGVLTTLPVDVIRHCVNHGYGHSLIDAFRYAQGEGYEWIVTMDCDEQHEPERLPDFFAAIAEEVVREKGGQRGADIISGSRYLRAPDADALALAPTDRRRINDLVTREINDLLSDRLGVLLTDSFCGFKAHRVEATARLRLSEGGYAFPMQLWARAAAAGLRVREIPVELIYNDPSRTFGEGLDDPEARLRHYREVLHREMARNACRVPAQGGLKSQGVNPRPCEPSNQPRSRAAKRR